MGLISRVSSRTYRESAIMRICGAPRSCQISTNNRRQLSSVHAALVNVHSDTTEAEIVEHPALIGVKGVELLPGKSWKQQAIISFEEPRHKTESLLRARRLLNGHFRQAIPFSRRCRYRPVDTQKSEYNLWTHTRLVPHLNMDGVAFENLHPDTTADDISALQLDGISEIHMSTIGQLFRTHHPALIDKKISIAFFNSNAHAMDIVDAYVINKQRRIGHSTLRILDAKVHIRNVAFLNSRRTLGYSTKQPQNNERTTKEKPTNQPKTEPAKRAKTDASKKRKDPSRVEPETLDEAWIDGDGESADVYFDNNAETDSEMVGDESEIPPATVRDRITSKDTFIF